MGEVRTGEEPAAGESTEIREPRVTVETIGTPRDATARRRADLRVDELRILDLRALDSRRLRVVGSAYVCSDRDRKLYGGTEYLLVREPDNRADAHAVAVYGKGRQLGYTSAAKGAAISPLLEKIGADAYLVGGSSVTDSSIRLWVDLPSVAALRAYAAEHAAN